MQEGWSHSEATIKACTQINQTDDVCTTAGGAYERSNLPEVSQSMTIYSLPD